MAHNDTGRGKKRPRRFHHGRAAGQINDKKLLQVEPAFEAAETDQSETAARTSKHRADVADWEDCLDSAARSSPTALDPNMLAALG